MEKENLVKKVCEQLNITQRDLAKELGVPESTMARWAGGDISQIGEIVLNLKLENHELKGIVDDFKKVRDIFLKL